MLNVTTFKYCFTNYRIILKKTINFNMAFNYCAQFSQNSSSTLNMNNCRSRWIQYDLMIMAGVLAGAWSGAPALTVRVVPASASTVAAQERKGKEKASGQTTSTTRFSKVLNER